MKAISEEKRVLILLIVSTIAIIGIMVLLFFYEQSQRVSTNFVSNIIEESGSGKSAYEGLIIEAKTAYVFDGKTQTVLYEKNPHLQLPLASITKLMTAIVASERLRPQDYVAIDAEALQTEGDSGLVAGDQWAVLDLLGFTLIVSSNDGALALAYSAQNKEQNTGKTYVEKKATFVDLMNMKAREIGLIQTYFLNPTGLDSTDYTSGGYGSAQDVTQMLEYAIKIAGPALEATRSSEFSFKTNSDLIYTAENTNQIVNKIPGLIASKTGFTDLAGGNLVIAFDAGVNHPIYIAVLGSTIDGRFTDVEALIEKSLEALTLQ